MPIDPDADLDPDDLTEIAFALREWLAGDKYFMSPQHRRRKAILEKIEPPLVSNSLPPAKPPGEPTWAERVKRNRRR